MTSFRRPLVEIGADSARSDAATLLDTPAPAPLQFS